MEDEMWESEVEFSLLRYFKILSFFKELPPYALKILFVFSLKLRQSESKL
jgi:hypothetical protein